MFSLEMLGDEVDCSRFKIALVVSIFKMAIFSV